MQLCLIINFTQMYHKKHSPCLNSSKIIIIIITVYHVIAAKFFFSLIICIYSRTFVIVDGIPYLISRWLVDEEN